MELAQLLPMMAVGYLLTVSIEAPILFVGLSRRYPIKQRLFAGFWLTACTYPIVWLVLPQLFNERWLYLTVAETFAPVAECLLFWFAFGGVEPPSRRQTLRDMGAIVVANLCSFGLGELFNMYVGWGWLVGS
jgi:hypothetical protein